MKEKRIPTNIKVHIINVESLEKSALAFHLKNHPNCGYTKMRAGYQPIGYVMTKKGMFVIDNEGTGNSRPITKDNKAEIDFYGEGEKDGKKFGCCLPEVGERLDDIEIKSLATGETQNLAAFIRSFGSRLENNYKTWRVFLEDAGLIE